MKRNFNIYWNARLTVNLSLSRNLLAGSQEKKTPELIKSAWMHTMVYCWYFSIN